MASRALELDAAQSLLFAYLSITAVPNRLRCTQARALIAQRETFTRSWMFRGRPTDAPEKNAQRTDTVTP